MQNNMQEMKIPSTRMYYKKRPSQLLKDQTQVVISSQTQHPEEEKEEKEEEEEEANINTSSTSFNNNDSAIVVVPLQAFHCATSILRKDIADAIKSVIGQCFETPSPIVHGEVFWLEHNSRIVSVLVVNSHAARPFIWNLCTIQDYRGKGCASCLIQEVKSWIVRSIYADKGVFISVSKKNSTMLPFYTERHGFTAVPDISSSQRWILGWSRSPIVP